jgi:DNA-binding GntR family transcriptional regulator
MLTLTTKCFFRFTLPEFASRHASELISATERNIMRIKIPENLTQQAYRLIRDEILQGKLNNRQRLTEDYFAQEFQISKSPVREALNRLEAEGLIKIIPRRGAFVRDFSLNDVEEIYQMREILEAAVMRGIKINQKLADRRHARCCRLIPARGTAFRTEITR